MLHSCSYATPIFNFFYMAHIRQIAKQISTNKWFELSIMIIILLNSVLIGVELYTNDETIKLIQSIILGIFTIEIIIRFIAADSVLDFFKDGWNLFDLSLVVIGYIPTTIVSNGATLMALRVLRVFRILRLLRAAKEVKLIVSVLIKSMSAMFYNLILFVIFIYLYAVAGVSMFRLPDPNKLNGDAKIRYEKFMEEAPNAPANSPDPFGNLGEASFTLFRELTGEDWTDIRYNLVTASKYDLIKINPTVVTIYHVSWFCISAFLLLNLVTGAIINNYQLAIEQQEERRKRKENVN